MSNETTTYTEQIAKIRAVRLGWEDHGIFTCMVDLDYGGSGQGAGGYCLDEPRHGEDGEFIGRFGTAFGMEWIIRLMRAVDARDFSKVQGRTVIALRDEGYNGRVRGIKPLPAVCPT
jgi:hypothetical protein